MGKRTSMLPGQSSGHMMYDKPARIKTLELPENRRILVISDIHGNMDYFTGLLKKVDFSDEDILIIAGDFLEKGTKSLDTLRYIMELSRRGNTFPLLGNCDDWTYIFQADERVDEHILHYILYKKKGLIWDMCNEAGIDLFELDSFGDCKKILSERYRAEWDFLASLPHAIETENFIFAHASLDPSKPLKAQLEKDLVRCDHFLTLGHSFEKWVVVGHWPVQLYGEDRVCANPIVDREHKIISIDGACVLKDDGQLNAFIIPHKFSDDFSFISYDPFPEKKVMDAQSGGGKSYYIRWGDSSVQVLERGEEFSRCRHVRTGYEMDILTKYLFTDNDITDCNDCTDYVLPLEKGDIVRVVEETSRGFFVKHKGWSGWYFGRIESI